MHELSIAESLLNDVRAEMNARKLVRVTEIGVGIGEISDVVPEALESAYAELRKRTEFADTALRTRMIPLEAMCQSCKKTFGIPDLHFQCPACLSERIVVQHGEELVIDYIKT